MLLGPSEGGTTNEATLVKRYSRLIKRISFFTFLIVVSWCVMALSHEMGHIVCGWLCGAKLIDADLLPWHMPYSFFEPDPTPLVTLWGGPVLGVLVPVIVAACVRKPIGWFVAHFCLLANGAYIAVGWFTGEQHLDTTKLLDHGAFQISIVTYCVLTIGFGYAGFRHHCIRVLWPGNSGV